MSTVRIETSGAVATLRLARTEARNAVNLALCLDLKAAMESLAADAAVRVVVLAADGPVFSAGADLKERAGKDAAWVRERRLAAFAAYQAISDCPKPAIAAIDGACIGSGAEIATSCDFILASERAVFRYPEAQWGTVGATQRLPRIVGKAMAKELIFTGRELPAEEALRIGLVNRVIPSDRFAAEVAATAEKIAAVPPLALSLIKRAIDRGTEIDLKSGLAVELEAIDRALAAREWQDGVAAFARRKGKPE
ncbi:MAG: enoyl-CoA hydratase/isomerase family protein [Alphaproteobacteria bacterium]|nr:enoyl-CoA hydratase/isomerase family protein [Alphaproteobacteria bacterium]